MKKRKNKYQKPAIKTEKIKLNFFMANTRYKDSIDSLIQPNLYLAQFSCDISSCDT